MRLDVVIFLMFAVAAAMGLLCYVKGRDNFKFGIDFAWNQFKQVFVILLVAMMLAAYLSKVVPEEMVGRWLGSEAGFQGILLASAIGGLVPGGPTITFPLIVALSKMGVALPSLIAFLTAWSCYAFHRIIAFEIPFVGWRLTTVRFIASFFVPPLAGVLAGLLVDVW